VARPVYSDRDDIPHTPASLLPSLGQVQDVAAQMDGRRIISQPGLLLDARLAELAPGRLFDSGAWVLTIQSAVLETPLAGQVVVPLVARISLGAGAAASPLEVDAFPGAIVPFHGDGIRVDLIWNALPAEAVAPGLETVVPALVRVVATVRRGAARGIARRSFVLARSGAGSVIDTGLVPPFAARCFLAANETHQAFANNTSWVSLDEVGQVRRRMLGLQLGAIYRAGGSVDVPAACNLWNYRCQNGESQTARVCFDLSF